MLGKQELSFIEYLLLLLLDTRKSNKPMLPVPNTSANVCIYPFTSGIWKREFLFVLFLYYMSRLLASPLES